jgi:hypothetical protein
VVYAVIAAARDHGSSVASTCPAIEMDGHRQMWSRAVFDRFVVEDAESRVRRHLLASGLSSTARSPER